MKREEVSELVERGICELNDALASGKSDRLQQYLDVMARFPRYSFNNFEIHGDGICAGSGEPGTITGTFTLDSDTREVEFYIIITGLTHPEQFIHVHGPVDDCAGGAGGFTADIDGVVVIPAVQVITSRDDPNFLRRTTSFVLPTLALLGVGFTLVAPATAQDVEDPFIWLEDVESERSLEPLQRWSTRATCRFMAPAGAGPIASGTSRYRCLPTAR